MAEEKVLGFFESDLEFPLTCGYAHVEKSKLVPVVLERKFDKEMERKNKRIRHLQGLLKGKVSLEWLEKYCKEKQFTDWEGKCSCGKEFTISHPAALKYLQVSDLLLAAEKESERK